MKPVLVLALGSSLAGDDAIGTAIAAAAAADPDVSSRADIVIAGTDLFRHAGALVGRRRVVLVDAALSTAETPSVRVLAHPLPTVERRAHAHALDPVAAVELLNRAMPELAGTEFWWLLVEVPEVTLGSGLSPAAAGSIPEAVSALRQLVLELPLP